jgi:phage terminase large subunit-like protein
VHVQRHAAPKDCRLDDRASWQAANPALGSFLNEDQFADAAERAKRSPSFERSFRLLNLNQRVASEGRFIERDDWESNGEPFDPVELEGKPCYGGLDLSSTRDLTAFSLWFPDGGQLLSWHFVPRDTVDERAEKDRVPYPRWADDGWIELTNGRATDRLAIVRRLAEVRQSYDVRGIGFDRWRFEDLAKLLADEGIELPLVEFVPGFRTYAPALDAFEAALLERRLRHNGNPVLRWQAGNVVVESDAAGNRKPAKSKSLDRIDGIVTAIMACGLAARHEGPAEYRGEGAMWL